jgi:hypothetical protein
METIACFVARTRGPVVPFVDDWYPWAYAHHYLRTEIENMPLELGRVLSSVRVDDAVALIHGWCAATGEDVDEAVHLLADAYLERWGLAPPEDRFAAEYDSEADLDPDADLGPAYGEDDGYRLPHQDAYDGPEDDPYPGDDPTEIIPVVRTKEFDASDEEAAEVAAEAEVAAKADRAAKNGRASKPEPAKNGRAQKPEPPAKTGPPRPRPVKAAERAMLADQIMKADTALVSEHPLVTGRSLATRR